VLEDIGVQTRNVDSWEDGKGTDDDGPEKELVAVNILEEWEARFGRRVKAEHASSDVLEFPSRDQNQPSQLSKDRRTSTEDWLAGTLIRVGVVRTVAVVSETAVIDAVDDDDKCHEGANSHDKAVDEHIDHDLWGENTPLDAVGWSSHNF
jgi:hypothetical protein